MDVTVFVWTALFMSAALLVISRRSRRPFEPTLVDMLFALSVAGLVALLPPG